MTSKRDNAVFSQTISKLDVYEFDAGKWLSPDQCPDLPTQRAGNSVIAIDGKLVVGCGESADQKQAHDEVEVFDPETKTWSAWPSMNQGRHGTGLVQIGEALYTASGSGNRGGGPELESTERLLLKE